MCGELNLLARGRYARYQRVSMVQLTDAQQRVLLLKPEGVSYIPNLAGVVQLTVRLPDELAGGGDVTVRVTADGVASNSATCQLKPARPL
jgi:hypothetical protein